MWDIVYTHGIHACCFVMLIELCLFGWSSNIATKVAEAPIMLPASRRDPGSRLVERASPKADLEGPGP